MSDHRIGFLGLGTMGAAMAANLARAGFAVTAWNRSPGRAPELDDLGVARAETPADGRRGDRRHRRLRLRHARCRGRPVRPATALADGARAGQLVIDCSTISPSATRDFAGRLARARRRPRRCAGLGRQRGRPEGDADDLLRRRRRRTSSAPGRSSRRWARRSPTSGRAAPGQAVKAVNQVILAGTYLGVAEGIVLAIKAGLDVEPGRRGARRRRRPELGPRQPERADARRTTTRSASRSRSIARTSGSRSSLAREMGADLPGRRAGRGLRDRPRSRRGHADDDMSALARVIRERSGLPS